jgi:putative membrane protein (TIGR04086 family)
MLRRVVAILAGLVVGFLVVALLSMVSGMMYPPPPDLNINDTEGLMAHMQSLPPSAFMMIIFAHSLGTFTGAFLASKLARANKFYYGLFVGALFVVASISNDMMLPHPNWMIVSDIICVAIAAYLGGRLGARG